MQSGIDEGLQHFLNSVANHRLLTAQEERDLARRARAGDEGARHQLIECNIRLVISIARRYRNRGLPLADIIQEGVLGLDRASRKFDPELGYRFSTYATLWIRQAIQRGISGAGSTIRLPPQVAEHRAKLRARMASDPEATMQEIGNDLELSVEEIDRALEAAEVVTSIDRHVSADDEYTRTLLDTVADPHADDPSDVPDLLLGLEGALDQLTPMQQKVIRLRFGFGGNPPLSLAEVAAELKLSTTTVQTAQKEALKSLRDLLDSPTD